MIWPLMDSPVVRRILFTVMFPQRDGRHEHVPRVKLHSLVKRQLSDLEVIETIDHLFRCQRCFENYRHIRKAYQSTVQRGVPTSAR